LVRKDAKGIGRAQHDGATSALSEAERNAALCKLLQAAVASRPRGVVLGTDPWIRAALVLVALAVLCLAGLAAGGGLLSSPDLRESVVPDPDVARLTRYAQSRSSQSVAAGPMSIPQGLPDVETMIDRLATRLASQPDDAEGWGMLGWSYANTERAAKAVDAYAKAISLRPDSSPFRSAYGEALVAAAGGTVTPEATDAFKAALAIDAQNFKARYFMALGQAQAGNKKAALDALFALQAERMGGAEEEPVAAEVREQIETLARELNVSPETPARAADAGSASRSPTREDVENIQAMPPNAQQQVIREMVEGLARRLQQSPEDEQGWIRLMRSRIVLGERAAAHEALARALATFSNDAAAKARIASAAREFGLAD
jgi:cytochrome c-type biogenesis protein CcmH